jgi:hypothetical protein
MLNPSFLKGLSEPLQQLLNSIIVHCHADCSGCIEGSNAITRELHLFLRIWDLISVTADCARPSGSGYESGFISASGSEKISSSAAGEDNEGSESASGSDADALPAKKQKL